MIYSYILWAASIVSGLLAGLTYYQGTAGMGVVMLIAAVVTGAAAVLLGIIHRVTRVILAGAAGLLIAFSIWFGYFLYQGSRGWLEGISKTGWVQPSDVAFLKGIILLLPLIVSIAMIILLFGWSRKGKKKYQPVIKPVKSKGPLDIEVCKVNGSPVILKHMDRYLHTMVVGTTGTGKSSRVLKPMIEQDLEAIAKGEKLGITVIEPKGDFADDVAAMCRSMKVPYIYINPLDPATPVFNPMSGEPEVVAEIMRTVLRSLFGKQEAFFRLNQEVAARNTALLVKKIKGEEATMLDMVDILRDRSLLAAYVSNLERREGESALTQYFKTEVMGELRDKVQQFTLGLRLQLEDITGNRMMRRVLIGKSDVDLDKHLSEGGMVLIVNTAMGELGKLGDAFGQFIMMHFQQAVFRRKGTERTRTPHFLYIDEFPRYVNPDFERLLAIGRSFRCAAVLALQTTAQMVHEDRPTFRDIVLETCRNKIVLNLGSEEDAMRFAKEFGEYEYTVPQYTYKRKGILINPWHLESMKEEDVHEGRFSYTELMELPKFHAVVRIVRDGEPQPPVLGKLELSKWDRSKNLYREEKSNKGIEVKLPEMEKRHKEKIEVIFGPDVKSEGNDDENEGFFLTNV
ncbi:hypothetical protein AN618_22350 [Fervidicola ferrireducens]|uniref:Type IV secretion system coupling protein TraD DNA-binding domain-containing protein n=1 Tax=Fervidicola ferrireducens TaxID=520764 RepID=A0A140L213_9FIRM|nr:type IV secretion system DNA-binding domain-containing protein [Fervidicola ferrireducens]KXG74588.1 hypothetical protein AN618_22350 [Fervidicola ferrireducens]